MAARISFGLVVASTLWTAAHSAASADQPPAEGASPRVAAAMPRVTPAASTPATPVSTAQVGAVPGPNGLVTPPMTLWRFLGIPQGLSRVAGATVNRRGNLPGLEPKPPLKALADPANLASKNPAIKKAAEIKQEEDLAKQKIKALKYLAKIGCGCYPGVKEALIAALDDCTEKVRYEAAQQIGNAAENKCETCSKTCCCDAEMLQALYDKATKRDDNGCFLEPSERVREAACQAYLACRRSVPVYPAAAPQQYEGETIPERRLPPGETIPDAPPGAAPAPNNETRSQEETDALLSELFGIPAQGKRPGASARMASATTGSKTPAKPGVSSIAITKQTAGEAKPGPMLSGRVVDVDRKTGTVDLEFSGHRQPTVGSRLSLHHAYAFESVRLGEVEVVYLAQKGRAIARPVGQVDLLKVAKGDQVSGRASAEPAAGSIADEPAPHVAPSRPTQLAAVQDTRQTPRPRSAVIRSTKPASETSMPLHPANAEPARASEPKPTAPRLAPAAKVETAASVQPDEADAPLPPMPSIKLAPAANRPSVVAAPAAAPQATIRVAPAKPVRKSAVIRSEPAAEEVEEPAFERQNVRRPAESEKSELRLTSAEEAKPKSVEREPTETRIVYRGPTKPAAVKPLESRPAPRHAVREAAEPRIIEPLKTAHVSAPKASEITFAPPEHPATKSPAKRGKQPADEASADSWVVVGD
jgi:hypothetical protein